MTVALSLLILASRINESTGLVPVYLPLAVMVMLMIGAAGSEFSLFLHRLDGEKLSRQEKEEFAEREAIQRQRMFNYIWQQLAGSQEEPAILNVVLNELRTLFSPDLIAVWSERNHEEYAGFKLLGTDLTAQGQLAQLDKIGWASPCFVILEEKRHPMRLADFPPQTSRVLLKFCEDHEFREVILCPVLVRHKLVGVLAFFYQEPPNLSSKVLEEMQAAANLFLCAR